MAPSHQGEDEPSLYEILSLAPKSLEGQPATSITKLVRKAYHRALLQNHPDKANPAASNNNNNNTTSSSAKPTAARSSSKSKIASNDNNETAIYTIDQIQQAYTVLSDSRQRAEYNRDQRLRQSSSAHSFSTNNNPTRQQQQQQPQRQQTTASASYSASFRTGVETVDLDDLEWDEKTDIYHRPCRCGNPQGFRFADSDLEAFADQGILLVECRDCSLWIRVLFAVADDDEEEEEEKWVAEREKRSDVSKKGDDNMSATSHRRSSTGKAQGNGWSFNWSFNLGVSVGGSASASASTGKR